MKAIILEVPGDPEVLKLSEQPVPELGKEEVLIQVKAISINPIDFKTRKGGGAFSMLKNDDPIILGWDVAGVVIKKGALVVDFDINDEVFGMVNFPGHGRTYAQFVAAPASHLALKPANISFEEAAATTLAALTAYQALYTKGKISAEDKVLIHAAAGGVGHFAVQLARIAGAYVIGTASSKNAEFVLGLGADEHIDYHGEDLENKVTGITLCLDALGGDNIQRSLELMEKGGRLISIPSGKNDTVEEEANAYGVEGSIFKVASNGADMKLLAGWLQSGKLKPHISAVLALEEMALAHEKIEGGRTVGKVVITVQ